MIPQLTMLNSLRRKHKSGLIDNSYFELFRHSHVQIKLLCRDSHGNDPGISKVCSSLLSELLNKEFETNEDLEKWVRCNYKSKRETLNVSWSSNVQHLFVRL